MKFDELQRQIHQLDFDATQMNRDGFETNVILPDGLDYVIKLSKHPLDTDAYRFMHEGFQTSVDYLGGLIARTSIVKNLTASVLGEKAVFPEAFIQERITPLDEHLDALAAAGDEGSILQLARQIAELDRAIAGRGCYVSDNYLRNCGLTSEGNAVLFDLGDVTRDVKSVMKIKDPCFRPGEPKGEAHRLNKRGYVIYERSGLLGQKSRQAKAAYEEALGLTFNPDVDIYKFTMRDVVALTDTLSECFSSIWKMPVDSQLERTTYLAEILRSKEPFSKFQVVYSALIRNMYASEFRRIAEEEIQLHFNEAGNPIASEPMVFV